MYDISLKKPLRPKLLDSIDRELYSVAKMNQMNMMLPGGTDILVICNPRCFEYDPSNVSEECIWLFTIQWSGKFEGRICSSKKYLLVVGSFISVEENCSFENVQSHGNLFTLLN